MWLVGCEARKSVPFMKNVLRVGRRPENCPKSKIRLVIPTVKGIIKTLGGVSQMIWCPGCTGHVEWKTKSKLKRRTLVGLIVVRE